MKLRKPVPAALFLLAGSVMNASAIAITWDGDTTADWADGANWTGGAAPANNISTDSAVFNAATANQPNLAANRSVSGISVAGNAGTLNWTISGASGVSLTLGSGGIDSTGFRDGTVTVSVPTIIMGSTAATVWSIFDNTASLSTNSVFTVNSNIQVNATSQLDLLSNRASTGTGTGVVNLNGVISGTTAGGVRLRSSTGSRNSFNLAAANSYSGGTIISQVAVTFTALANSGSDSSFGASGGVTLGDNSSFASASYTGSGSGTTDRLWTLNGAGGGTINNNSNNATGGALAFTNTSAITAGTDGARTLTLGGTFTAAANTMAGLVSDMTGFATAVSKNGASTWRLTNTSNSFTGVITAVGGVLELNNVPDTGDIRYNGGTVTFTGSAADSSSRLLQLGTTAGSTITANLKSSGSAALEMTATGDVKFFDANTKGGISLGGSHAGDNIFRARLTDNGANAMALSKVDAGKWILTAAHTYTGATNVTGGTLLVNGSLGTTTTTVSGPATLGGTGTLAGAVNVSGSLAPGASIESLATGSLALLAGSTLKYELQDAGATGADLVDITGNLSLAGTVTLDLVKLGTGSWALNDKLTLLSYTGSLTANSLFSYADGNDGKLADGEVFSFDGVQWVFDYNDSLKGANYATEATGSFVTMTVVPESSSALLGGMALLFFLRRRR